MNRPEPTYSGGPGQRAARAARDGEASEAASKKGTRPSRGPVAIRPADIPRRDGGDGPALRASAVPAAGAMARGREGAAGKAGKTGKAAKGLKRGSSRARARGVSGAEPGGTLLKNLFGVLLLPLAWVWTVSFAGLFSEATVRYAFWTTEDFWFFSLGCILWLLTFSGGLYMRGVPPFLKMYVRFHEWTHAIWAWQSNGRVEEIQINEDHGHVLTNKPTVLVTLAPYFYPLPCIVLVILYLPLHVFYHPEQITLLAVAGESVSVVGLFVLLMGLGWSFHITYTVWMIRKGQSDLRMHGNLFSLVVIYLVNLAAVTLFLLLTAAQVDGFEFWVVFKQNAVSLLELGWRVALYIHSAAVR